MTNSEMYKNLVNKTLSILLILSIYWYATASVNIYDLLEKKSDNIQPISKIYTGKPVIKDLFSKNLELVKNNEVKITNQALEQISEFYANKNCYIKKSDILNIVINSNYWSLYTLESTLLEQSNQKSWIPSSVEINKSYKKLLDCKKNSLQQNTYQDIKNIEIEVNWLYTKIVDNEYKIETKNQENFWEDLFWNWDNEDSSFDILEDIYNIWHILMQNFNKQVKLYFYDLPNQNNWGPNLSFNNIIWKKLASNEDITDWSSWDNSDINNFITQVNQINNTEKSSYEESNQCINITDNETKQENTSNSDEEYEKIIESVQDFIYNANSDNIVNQVLSNKFKEETKTNASSWTKKSDDDIKKENNEKESFIEKNIILNKSCTDKCTNWWDIWKQEKCELDCSLSCFEKCDSIKNNVEKVVCKSECVCFMVSWPEKPLANWLIDSDIYKIRFCKVPVMGEKIQRNKTVASIEDIVYEMNNVLKNLRDWWEMIKHVQTKEFLEVPVKINFWKLFSFGLSINRKKIPNTKQTSTLEPQKQKENKKKELSNINSNGSENEKDNYNKYIIIQSLAWDTTNKQGTDNINQRISNLNNEKELLKKLNVWSENPIKDSQNEKTISLTSQLDTFLLDNISFWKEFETIITNAKDISYSLKDKIKNSE